MHARHSRANRRGRWLVKWLKLDVYKRSREKERGDKALIGKRVFRKDKWVFRRTKERWGSLCNIYLYKCERSFHLLQGFMVSEFFLLWVDLPGRGNLWQLHFREAADFSLIQKYQRKLLSTSIESHTSSAWNDLYTNSGVPSESPQERKGKHC